MPLLQLPPEILHLIIGYARPQGFEPLMLTCKQIHNRGKAFLAEHNTLRRLFGTLDIHSAELTPDTGIYNLTEILIEIVHSFAQRPELGWFVKHLDIRFGHSPSVQGQETLAWLREDRKQFEQSSGTQVSTRPTQKLIENNPWLKAAGFDVEAWTKGAPELWSLVDDPNDVPPETENFGETSWLYLLVLLLTKTSRLRSLHGDNSLTTSGHDASAYPSLVLDLMSSRVGNDGSYYSDEHIRSSMEPSQRGMIRRSVGIVSPLENLEEVRFCLEPEYDHRANPSQLDAFLTSPYVRKLSATNLVAVFDGYTGIPYTWPSPDGEITSLLSNRRWGGIEHLELLGCCIDAQGLTNIVSHLPFLTTFRLAFQTKWHGCGHDWSAGEVVQALAKCEIPDVSDRDDNSSLGDGKNIGKRLLAPQITDLAINVITHYGAIISGVSDLLHGFTGLKRLSIDMSIFLGPTVEEMQDSDDNASSTTDDDASWVCEESHVPRLVDLIPAGVEELELVCKEVYEMSENWTILLRGFVEEEEQKLPNLKKLILRGKAFVEEAGELGLGAYVVEGDPDEAEWQVDFARREGWVR